MQDKASHHRAKIGALSRCVKTGERQPDDPELIDARRDLAAAKIAEYIKRVVDSAPPLSAEQRTQLAELLKPVRIQPSVPARRERKRPRSIRRPA